MDARGAPQIKICGITKIEEAFYLNEVQAEYAGFVFWEKSKRNVRLSQAEKICRVLEKSIRRVAVTVSPDLDLVRQIEAFGFDILQVHGRLQEEVVKQCSIPIWRACNLKNPKDMEHLERMERITGYVIDAGCAGSGRTFDWRGNRKMIEMMKATVFVGKTFVLAGGLNPKNVTEAVRMFQPNVVDVSSGVEGADGKEKTLVTEFVRKVRES